MVMATSTVDTAMKETAPRTWPPALTGPTEGTVSAGGAGTGGRGACGDIDVVGRDDSGDGEDAGSPVERGRTTVTRFGPCRDVGAGAGVGLAAGAGVAVGFGEGDGSRQRPSSRCSSECLWWQ
jgi:hypothetical protein